MPFLRPRIDPGPPRGRDEAARKLLAAAETRERKTKKLAQEASAAEKNLAQQVQDLDRLLADARVEYGDISSKAKQAKVDRDRLHQECGKCHDEMPSDYQQHIRDDPGQEWVATTYPARPRLDGAESRGVALAGGAGRVRESGGDRAALDDP